MGTKEEKNSRRQGVQSVPETQDPSTQQRGGSNGHDLL